MPTINCPCGESIDVKPSGAPAHCPRCHRALDAITHLPGENHLTADAPLGEPDTLLSEGVKLRDVTLPSERLCTPTTVGLATFLCGPMAGILMLSLNDGILRRRLRGWGTFGFGLLYCAALILVLWLVPDSLTGVGMNLLISLSIAVTNIVLLVALAYWLHGAEVEKQQAAGVGAAKGGHLIGRAVLGLILYFAVWGGVVTVMYLLFADTIATVAPGKTIHHTGRITDAEARGLGKFLLADGFLGGPGEQGVRLDRDGPTYVISFVVEVFALTPEARAGYRELAKRISDQVFGGATVRIEVLDQFNNVKAKEESGP